MQPRGLLQRERRHRSGLPRAGASRCIGNSPSEGLGWAGGAPRRCRPRAATAWENRDREIGRGSLKPWTNMTGKTAKLQNIVPEEPAKRTAKRIFRPAEACAGRLAEESETEGVRVEAGVVHDDGLILEYVVRMTQHMWLCVRVCL